MFNRRYVAVLCLALVAAAGTGTAAAEKRRITPGDIQRFVWVADPQVSPDGRQVAFVRVEIDQKNDGYETSIWMVPTDASEPPRPFTSGPQNDNAPRWSPDGSRLAFSRVSMKDGHSQPSQLWVIPMAGGEARAITDMPKGAEAAAWSPDGKRIAFVSDTTPADMEKAKALKPGAEPPKESDVRVISRAVYRANSGGYLDDSRPGHIWVVDVPAAGSAATAAQPQQVTQGSFEEAAPVWSADGNRIYFTSERVKEPYYARGSADLFEVPATGGEPKLVVSIDGDIGPYALSPGGSRVVFEGRPNANPVRSYDQTDLFVSGTTPGVPARNLTEGFDNEVGDGLAGDQHPPRGASPALPIWTNDGKTVVIRVAEKGRANLVRIDVSNSTMEPLTEGDVEVVSFTATPDGSRFALVISNPLNIGNLYYLDAREIQPGKSSLRKLTDFNAELFDELDLTAPEEITWKSFDGKVIHGWVQKPPDYVEGKAYPTILNIHGGPHSAYGYTFFHEMQCLAAKGYVVFYPNPRGSTTYGQSFANIIQFRFPGDDYKDLMSGVDELVKRGIADPAKLGVTGGSGGGILTNYVVTQTNRFQAAVAQRSIANWTSWWYTADFTMFTPQWFHGAPFERPAEYAARSPINFVDRIRTPMMFIEGEADLRTPPTSGGEQLFRALKYLKRPTVMVQFPGETHELSRSGKPSHRIERLNHISAWFDKYLLGTTITTYDVQ